MNVLALFQQQGLKYSKEDVRLLNLYFDQKYLDNNVLNLLFKLKLTKYRPARLGDINRVLAITDDARALFKEKGSTQWQDLDGYPHREAYLNDLANEALYVYDDGRIEGICTVSFLHEKAYDNIEGKWLNETNNYSVIHRIATSKECYQRGIGQGFLDLAYDLSRSRGVKSIKVDTGLDNDIMLHMFIKNGYHNCGIIYLLREAVIDKKRVAFEKMI